jgi:hypothetical protein
MLARIHATPAPEPLRSGESAWTTALRLDDSPLQERLRALAGSTPALLHFDYHPMNVMTDGHAITGVLDWANTHTGDPRADLARTLAILGTAPLAARGIGERLQRQVFLGLFTAGCLRGYVRRAGPLREMAPFRAWGWAITALDLEPHLNRPDHWLRPRHLEAMRRRSEIWKRRGGV